MSASERCEISDEEFEANLEKVWEAWEAGRDTFDIAKLCGISEAKAAYILSCYIEGKFVQTEEERLERKKVQELPTQQPPHNPRFYKGNFDL